MGLQPTDPAENPRRERIGQTRRAADHYHRLPNFDRVGVAQRHRRQAIPTDSNQGEIPHLVDIDQLGRLVQIARGQPDLDPGRSPKDVQVGDDGPRSGDEKAAALPQDLPLIVEGLNQDHRRRLLPSNRHHRLRRSHRPGPAQSHQADQSDDPGRPLLRLQPSPLYRHFLSHWAILLQVCQSRHSPGDQGLSGGDG